MAITAFTSTAIIDATTIGTTVLTASSAGIAADAIGLGTTDDVTFNSVDCVNGDFSGTVTANTLTSTGGNLTLQRNSSDSIIIGGTFIQCYQEVRPSVTNTYSSGTTSLRWSNVASVDGDFSGTLSAVTVAGQTNTLLLRSNGGTSNISLSESGAITLTAYGNIYQQFTLTGVNYREDCIPTFNGTLNLGLATNRWANVASVDGSFSGSLNSEAGGSYKLYNLGAEGDTDTEYLDMSWNGGSAYIGTQATGSGANRTLFLQFGGQNRVLVSSSEIRVYRHLRPSDTTIDIGSVANPFRTGYFGNMTLSNLPTSDPVVAGELWNDSGTVKISSG